MFLTKPQHRRDWVNKEGSASTQCLCNHYARLTRASIFGQENMQVDLFQQDRHAPA